MGCTVKLPCTPHPRLHASPSNPRFAQGACCPRRNIRATGAGRGYALPRRGQRDMGEPMVPPGPSGHPTPSFGALPVGQATPALLRRAPRGRSCFRNHATPHAALRRGLFLGTASCRFDCDAPRRRAAVRLGFAPWGISHFVPCTQECRTGGLHRQITLHPASPFIRITLQSPVRGKGGAPHAKEHPRPPFGGQNAGCILSRRRRKGKGGDSKGVRENRRFAHTPLAPAARSRKPPRIPRA